MEQDRYRKFLASTPNSSLQYPTGYNFEGPELQALIQQCPDVIQVMNLDLRTAQNTSLLISFPGRAVTLFGYQYSNQFNPQSITGTEGVEPSVYVNCRVQFDRAENAFPLKHNRGFRGPFTQLFLQWPAQTNLAAKLVVYKYDGLPWSVAEADSTKPTSITTRAAVTVSHTVITQIVAADPSRKSDSITNLGSTNLFVGDSGVTIESGANPGTLIVPNGIVKWTNTAALYGIAKTSDVTVSVNSEI